VDVRGLVRELRVRSSTGRGQLAGAALIAVPALVNPMPVDGAAHAVVMVLAVAVGVAGAVVVFGGLFQWVFLPSPADGGTGDDATDPDDSRPAAREALRTVPHARAVWAGLVVLCVALAAGAGWVLTRAVTDGWADHLPAAVMLALAAGLLGWAAWAARAMRTA
jgi:hypothetical protein